MLPNESTLISPLDLRVSYDGDSVVVSPAGEICISSAPLLREALDAGRETGARRVVVDLADVTLLTAAGLSVLAIAARRLDQDGRTLACRNATGLAARTLRVTGLGDLLEHAATGLADMAIAG